MVLHMLTSVSISNIRTMAEKKYPEHVILLEIKQIEADSITSLSVLVAELI